MVLEIESRLQKIEEKGRLRSLSSAGGIDLTSNDYLGFRNHPALRNAALAALENGLDLGSGGSRLLRGNHLAHVELETFAAAYFGHDKALFMATGFQANIALFKALPDRRDVILFDELIHASARDGIQASHARHIRLPHNDLDAFESALKKHRDSASDIWIAVESLYSMDGDFAPLPDLLKLAQKYEAWLVVDEAHATGVWGDNGKGCCAGLSYDRLITLQTCGKALGVAGGLICGPAEIIDLLINTARPFIYSTAPMPLQAVLVKCALELLQQKTGQEARQKLYKIIEHTPNAQSQIVPIIIGEDDKALQVAEELQKNGYDIRGIRPPTVPEGSSRLRLSLSADLTSEVLNNFFECLDSILYKKAA